MDFALKLRIPGWARGASAMVNGNPFDIAAVRDGYLTIARRWQAGDTVTLDLPMPPERIYAHPAVSADLGRVALKRGPLVYCIEEADNPDGPVQRLVLPRSAELRSELRQDLFHGIDVVTADAARLDDRDWHDTLYRTAPPKRTPAQLTAVPYYLWNNRGSGTMTVWVPEVDQPGGSD